MSDRIEAICDLLLGAAYADEHLHDNEKQAIRELLAKLVGGEGLPDALAARIDAFDPQGFEPTERAAVFADDPPKRKRTLVELIAAVHEADGEYDLAEDDYLRAVAEAIGLDGGELSDLTLEYEVEDLKQGLRRLRAAPPPVPG